MARRSDEDENRFDDRNGERDREERLPMSTPTSTPMPTTSPALTGEDAVRCCGRRITADIEDITRRL